jgi:hypothetical protein
LLVLGSDGAKMTAQHFDRFLILRRRFGTIKQTQVKRRFVSKKLDYRQVSPRRTFGVNNT